MTTTVEQIDLWRAERSEHQRLEFKEAKNQFDNRKLCRYCVALANEGGGVLLLGIEDRPPRRVVGTSAFNDPVAMAAKLHRELNFRVDIDEVRHPDGRVLVFHLPSRPRGSAYKYDNVFWMRAGQELVAMSDDRLRSIFDEGKPDWLSMPAMDSCSAEQVIGLLDTQSYFDLMQLPYPENRLAVLDRLEREKLIERTGDQWGITNLAAVLFAKSLRAFDGVRRKAPRVVVYGGNNKLDTKKDTTDEKGYAVGFRSLLSHIDGQLPANEVIGPALRENVRMYPEVAVRELVANALIHQDFTESGTSILVEIYTDRMEVSNPGVPTIQPERFIDEYQSRNEKLADLMRRMRICEEKGSGVDKIVDAAEHFQLPAPDFRVGERRTTAILFAHQAFDDMEKVDRVRACYQHCCLRYVTNEKMTNQSLRDRFKLPTSKAATVSAIIAAAVESGRIKLDDANTTSRRYAKYVPHWA